MLQRASCFGGPSWKFSKSPSCAWDQPAPVVLWGLVQTKSCVSPYPNFSLAWHSPIPGCWRNSGTHAYGIFPRHCDQVSTPRGHSGELITLASQHSISSVELHETEPPGSCSHAHLGARQKMSSALWVTNRAPPTLGPVSCVSVPVLILSCQCSDCGAVCGPLHQRTTEWQQACFIRYITTYNPYPNHPITGMQGNHSVSSKDSGTYIRQSSGSSSTFLLQDHFWVLLRLVPQCWKCPTNVFFCFWMMW